MATLKELDADEPPSLVNVQEIEEAKIQAELQARAPKNDSTRVPITIVTGKAPNCLGEKSAG